MKRAVLVIDMQNDYLWEKRKAKFSYDSNQLTGNVNQLIAACREKGDSILYIRQIFPDLWTNRLLLGFSIKGTPGAELYDQLEIASDLCFDKHFPDAYSSRAFREHMSREGYTTLILCGLDECGCVGATAKGAVKTGAKVVMAENCIGRRFPKSKVVRMRKKLLSMGVSYQTEI